LYAEAGSTTSNRTAAKEIAMAAGLPDFFRFNLWANLSLLDFCAGLSDAQLDATTPGTYGSVRDTLLHLYSGEEGYAHHFTDAYPTTPRLDDLTTFPGIDELRRRAERSGAELIRIASEADLDQVFHLDDGTYECPAVIVLIQAINHGDDHRSQICTILSQQGLEAPCLDAWCYNERP
jgi:uncharacterized damage-inducible protein DinB